VSEIAAEPTRVSRRDVMRFAVIGGVVGTLAGCTSSTGPDPKPTSPGGPEDPDRALRAEIGRDQARMTSLYEAADVPASVGAQVTAVGERHRAYGRAIDPKSLGSAPTSPTPSGSTPPSTEPSPSNAGQVPPTPIPTLGLKGLRRAELASSAVLLKQANRAADPELARLIVLAAAGSAAAAESLKMVAS
jgi:hypothetical protein